MTCRGKFYVLEGIDGSGKSTQAKLLKEYLEQSGRKVILTCEPTYEPIGKIIRECLTKKMSAHPITIATLFAADRHEHIVNSEYGILQYLEKGYDVVSDRYLLSSYAYQSLECDMDWVMQINTMNENLLLPDVNLYINLTAEASMQRIQANRDVIDLYETEEILQKVYQNYQTSFNIISDKFREKLIKINGNQSVQDIHHDIIKVVKEEI